MGKCFFWQPSIVLFPLLFFYVVRYLVNTFLYYLCQSLWCLCVVACGCDEVGMEVDDCDNSGQCICKHSFTGRTCDRCAAGFYRYPECTGALSTLLTLSYPLSATLSLGFAGLLFRVVPSTQAWLKLLEPLFLRSSIQILLVLLLHSFNGLSSRTTWVSRHQKSRTIPVKPIWIYWSKR